MPYIKHEQRKKWEKIIAEIKELVKKIPENQKNASRF